MHVSQLFIYPIKSLGGIALKQSNVTIRGLQFDRRYMLVDEDATFLTQRTLHQMALFKLNLVDNGFKVTYKNDSILIPFFMQGHNIKASVWDDVVDAILASETYNNWFSNALNKKVRLVFMGEESERPISKKYANNSEYVSFADAFPILMLSQASLNLLNSKLHTPLGMDRFRPNVVIENMNAHQEDELTNFSINSVAYRTAKLCARCVVTTINQHTLEKSKEPLATLSTYRLNGNSINFGQNIICQSTGVISVGNLLVIG